MPCSIESASVFRVFDRALLERLPDLRSEQILALSQRGDLGLERLQGLVCGTGRGPPGELFLFERARAADASALDGDLPQLVETDQLDLFS